MIDMWDGEQFGVPQTGPTTRRMGVDLADRGDEIVLDGRRAGFERSDIDLRFADDEVIHHRRVRRADREEADEAEETRYLKSERERRTMKDPFDYRNRWTKIAVRATYQKGVLTVTLRRRNRLMSMERKSLSTNGSRRDVSSPTTARYLSNAALTRATEYAEALDEDVVAATVIPEEYEVRHRARTGWTRTREFDVQTITSSVHEQVVEIASEASFRHERSPTSAPEAIATEIQRIADDEIPSVVFSEATTRAAS